MFQKLSIITFLLVFGGIGLHYVIFPCSPEKKFSIMGIIRTKIHILLMLFLPQKLNWIGRFKKLAFLLSLLCFLILLLTGFGPVLCGYHLSGYLLMIHVTFAGVFIAAVAFLALTFAGTMAYDTEDGKMLLERKASTENGCWLSDSGICYKTCYWILIALSLPVTLSIVLSMLPLFGTEMQEFLFHTHQYSTLLFAAVSIIGLYVLVRRQMIQDNHGE